MNRLDVIRSFGLSFGSGPLAETGYALAWSESRIGFAVNVEQVETSLAYVQGYASGCLIACPHGGRAFKIGDCLVRAMTALRSLLGTFASTDRVMTIVDTYRVELTELAALPPDEVKIVHVCATCGSLSPEACGC